MRARKINRRLMRASSHLPRLGAASIGAAGFLDPKESLHRGQGRRRTLAMTGAGAHAKGK